MTTTLWWNPEFSDFQCQLCGGTCKPDVDGRWRCTNCGRAESNDSAAARRRHSGAGLAGTGTSAGSGSDSSGPTDTDSQLRVPSHGSGQSATGESAAAAPSETYESADVESERLDTASARIRVENEHIRVERQANVLHNLYYARETVAPGMPLKTALVDRAILEALIYLVQNTPAKRA